MDKVLLLFLYILEIFIELVKNCNIYQFRLIKLNKCLRLQNIAYFRAVGNIFCIKEIGK